jgi:hypothetical protein
MLIFSRFSFSLPSLQADEIRKPIFLYFLGIAAYEYCLHFMSPSWVASVRAAEWADAVRSVSGLTRPPMYPFSAGQYPYPMLSPEMSQVAASW